MPTEAPERDEIRISGILVQPQLNQLRYGDVELRVEPKVMEVLTALAAEAGRPLSREDLLERVWPGVHVSDDALHRAVWKLRQALDEVAGAADLLETIPKRGYRLTGPIEGSEERPAKAPRGSSVRSRLSGWILAIAAVAVAGLALLFPVLRPAPELPEPPPRRSTPVARFEPLTALRGYESEPSFSPDGERVVFHHFHKAGARQGRTDLYVASVSGGEPVRLDAGPSDAMRPVWSPTDDRIAYVTRGPAPCRLQIATIGEPGQRDLRDCGAEEQPDDFWFPSLGWSADGSELFFSLRERLGEPARIHAMDLTTGDQRAVSDPPFQSLGDERPTVSPDGRHLAFVRRRADGVEDLYVVSLIDGRERRLTQDHQPIAGITWLRDSNELIFSSSRAGTFRLWRLPVDGGAPTPVDTVGMNATAPSLSSDGLRLAYEEWKSEINVWVGDSAGRRALLASTLWDWCPQFSPDGARIAFLSNREGSTELWVADADGSAARRLTQIGVHFASVPRWSPDGSRIALAAPSAGNFDIWSIEPSSGEARRLTLDASQERAPTWSADGSKLFFASDRAGGYDVWSMPAEGGAVERVTDGGARLLLEGPGGVRYLIRAGEPGVWRLLDEGRQELVVPDFPSSHWMNVDLVGDTLYLARFESDWSVFLDRLAPDGALERVRRLDGPDPSDGEWFSGSGLSVSPDGGKALWASVDRSDSDLWLAHYGAPAPPAEPSALSGSPIE